MPKFTSTDSPKMEVGTDRHNRYLIPRYPLDGPMAPGAEPIKGSGMDVPWTRVSTILDTHEDKEGIFKWTKRLVVKGIGARADLYALAAATLLSDKGRLLGIADQAFDYAGGQAASNEGSALHGFLERWFTGDKTLTIPEPWAADVAAVAAAFQDAGIRLRPDLMESIVVRPDLKDGDAAGLAGTLDLVVEVYNAATGEWEPTIADYKTGTNPLLYGAWKIQQQGGTYGSGWARWDGTHWHPMPANIRRDRMLMIHVLPRQASVQIHVVDVDPVVLEADLAAAYRTRTRRKAAKKCHHPLVTVEDGVVLAGAEKGIVEAMPAVREAVEAVKLGGTVQVTDQMLEDTKRAEERQAKINQNEAALAGATVAQAILNGEGKPLAPLAGPGKKGCSVCRRTGHRKGSPVCLGANDPGPAAIPDEPAVDEPRTHVHRDWTRNPMSGSWECGVEGCGHPAAEPVQAELTAAQETQAEPDTDRASTLLQMAIHRRAAGEETTGDAAILSGNPDHVRHWWAPNEEGGTEQELEDALAAGRMVLEREMSDGDHDTEASALKALDRRNPLTSPEEPDPFAEDDGLDELASDSPWHSYLDRINEAKDKATIRTIREEAKALNLWDDALHQAGLARIKSL